MEKQTQQKLAFRKKKLCTFKYTNLFEMNLIDSIHLCRMKQHKLDMIRGKNK